MSQPLRIDIVSDVVCPWCAVGYNQLRVALEQTGTDAEIHWHPFQLNPDMGPEGQNMGEHLAEKYGVSPEESARNRERISTVAAEVGFEINFSDEMRIYNTMAAHQLIHFASQNGREHDTKQALLKAYFTDGRDVSDIDVLMDVAQAVGLDVEAARTALQEETYAAVVGEHMQFWTRQGISGVPAIILDQKYLVNGAAGVENFKGAIKQALSA
ncbi:Predicted dithiol-disulfide isomerase, DsbA family [Cohaesibacter sp. ES.047]|uniref:DsbA family oxidoreductase n=1 Tax=Cohaesibacter sp. ES.047 TaxID=1798205 RepID=UPI000BB8405E|nr:DsbA family oxidoreductase [Cohaesibacter sp. ES.047]SNY90095.1 Predicted dithiol-disulfide isomerase, DsbA family [Cohaesibacter sp. ES.047]